MRLRRILPVEVLTKSAPFAMARRSRSCNGVGVGVGTRFEDHLQQLRRLDQRCDRRNRRRRRAPSRRRGTPGTATPGRCRRRHRRARSAASATTSSTGSSPDGKFDHGRDTHFGSGEQLGAARHVFGPHAHRGGAVLIGRGGTARRCRRASGRRTGRSGRSTRSLGGLGRLVRSRLERTRLGGILPCRVGPRPSGMLPVSSRSRRSFGDSASTLSR